MTASIKGADRSGFKAGLVPVLRADDNPPVTRFKTWRHSGWIFLGMALMALSCGGDSSPTQPTNPGGGGGGGGQTVTVTITANGADQRALTITPGMRVIFVNNDSRPHEMTSDPHPSHEDCPELNQVGFLNPGQQRESGNLVFTRTCGFHDHANPGTQSLQGRITIR
jgi:plastocyanin